MSWIDRMKRAVGIGSSAPMLAERAAKDPPVGGAIIRPLPVSLQLQRIGGSLTPQQVTSILRLADVGYMYRLVDLANDARQKDCHLQSVLQTREKALTGLRWQVLTSEKSTRADRKAAESIEEILHNCLTFSDFIEHQAGAFYPGYAVSEILYANDAGKIVPAEFNNISPRRFVFEQGEGKLHWWDAAGSGQTYPGVDFQALYPGKFVVHQPRVTGDVPMREGLVRVLMWASLFRNWTEADWIKLAELAWKPWRIGKYDKIASDADISALNDTLDAMSAQGVATVPKTVDVDVFWPQNSGKGNSNHKELFDTLGAEMSKAVLGQTLTTEQGSKGSQALGRVHDNVRRDILEADARSVAATIRRCVIAPFVRLNFGDRVQVPEFRFLTEDGPDLPAFALAVKTFRDAGLKIPAAWVRDVAGIPEPDEDDEVLSGPEPTEPDADDEDATDAQDSADDTEDGAPEEAD